MGIAYEEGSYYTGSRLLLKSPQFIRDTVANEQRMDNDIPRNPDSQRDYIELPNKIYIFTIGYYQKSSTQKCKGDQRLQEDI